MNPMKPVKLVKPLASALISIPTTILGTALAHVLLLLVMAAPAMAQDGGQGDTDWSRTAQAVTAQAEQAAAQAEETRTLAQQGQAAAKRELAELRASVAAKQQTFEALEARYQALLAQEQGLSEDLDQQAHVLKTMDGAIRTSAKQARDYFHESLTTPEFPDRAPALEEILQPDRFPGLTGIQTLLDLYLEEMRASGRTIKRTGVFTAEDGTTAQGEILRVGAFTAAYRDQDGQMGFLRPDDNGRGLMAVAGDPGWGLTGAMEDYFNGGGRVFPVDISNGAALMRLSQQQKSIGEWLSSGGLLVWPILLVGLAALVLVIERFVTLGRIRGNSDKHMRSILTLVARGQWKDCGQYCDGQTCSPTCRIIGHTLKQLGSTKEIVENSFQEGLLKELPTLERFLPTLAVLAAVAPLLGLLGTVTGMINTFQIITLYGTGDPRMMSGGISEALVTTQLGLAVAVPIMILHHVLDRRVDKIVGDMEEKGTSFAVALMKQNDREESHAA